MNDKALKCDVRQSAFGIDPSLADVQEEEEFKLVLVYLRDTNSAGNPINPVILKRQ